MKCLSLISIAEDPSLTSPPHNDTSTDLIIFLDASILYLGRNKLLYRIITFDGLTTNYAKNYCNRTLIVKVIVENVVTCFFGHSVYTKMWTLTSPMMLNQLLCKVGISNAVTCGLLITGHYMTPHRIIFLFITSMIFRHVGMLQQFMLVLMWGPFLWVPLFGRTCLNPPQCGSHELTIM